MPVNPKPLAPTPPKGGSGTTLPLEMIWRQQRNDLAVRFFERLITSDRFDVRAPMQAALCAKNCADVLMGVLSDGRPAQTTNGE